ncbi:uncharacterized protein LOC121324960 isoform X3 [Polyodon spathula]|uniref:uncharacterized protein LOC121324960 isoform X3 n=1 Tax=Polyodon spathula TaxID=7913 RepID=UPI001B7DC7D7|nr:uncharacterized protein LOC121324960 isoform X3 [Polyodon spathula]
MSSSSTSIPSLRRTGDDLNIQNNDGTTIAFFSSAITDSVIINNQTDITGSTSLDDIFGDSSEIQIYSNTNPFINFESAECKADDSSGSYHTAFCSETSEHFSNCSETFEFTKEDLSPEQTDAEPAASYENDFSQSAYKTEHLFYKASKNRNTDENTGQLTYSNQDNEQYSEMTSNSGSWKKSEQSFNTNKDGDQQDLFIAMRDKPHLNVVSTDLNLSNSRFVRHCVKDPTVSGRDRSGIGTERQAQLSLSSKNRNIPEHSSTQLPAREEQPGMTGCSDSACRFSSTTQEEKLWDAKKQNSTAHKRSTFSETNRHGGADCTSETSSMGSEFDEVDNEVKCLTDLAFKSLSYPQDDYLAIYNSSYNRSSTNVSQLSTERSHGVNAWPAYDDFCGSGINDADLPENKDLVDRFEMGSFECVDVALENQDQLNTSCSKRTVPKRQIQLKRQEGKVSPSRVLAECQPTSRPFERCAQDIFIRQHSTPAVLQDESNKPAEVLDENSKKQKLHKSVSLDETSSKAKVASSLIKNVLSKKMQQEHKLQLVCGDVQDAEPSSLRSPSSVCDKEFKYSNTSSRGNLYYGSGVTSDGSFSSEHLQMDSLMQSKFDSSKANKVSKLIIKHTGLNSKTQEKHGKYGFQNYEKSLTRDSDAAIITSEQGNKSRIGIPWSNKKLYGDNNYLNNVAKPIACTSHEKKLGDSESYVAKDSLESAPAEPASVWSAYESPKNDAHEAKTDDTQHFIRNVFTSKTPEITLRPRNRTEKKNHTFSIARLLSPNTEGKSSAKQNSELLFKSRATTCMDQQRSEQLSQLEVKDSNLKNKPKAPMHKVTDIRKLVKHTYSLSFKASAIISPKPADPEQTLEPPTSPPPLLVECKAISRQDSMLDPTSPLPECKAINRQDSMLDPTSPLPECKAISRQDSMLDPTSPPSECKAINRQDSMLDPTSPLPECKAISRQDSMLDPTSPPPECKAISRQDSMLDPTSPPSECKAISRQDIMLDPTSPLPLLVECKAIGRQDSMLDPTSPPSECKAISRQDSMLDPTSPPSECKAISRQDIMLDPTSPLPLLVECKAISRQDIMLDPTSPPSECKGISRQDIMLDPTSPPPECKAISRQDIMLDPTSPLPLLVECKAISRQDSMLNPTYPLPLLIAYKAISRQDSMLDPTSPLPECKAISRQDSMLDPTSPLPECKAISRQDSMLDPTSPPPECKAISRQDSMLDPTSPPSECKAISRQDSMLDPTSPPSECKAISRQDSMLDPTSPPSECKAISRQDSMLDPTSPPPECKAISRQDSMLDPTSPPSECKAVSRQDSMLDPTSPPSECKAISRQDSMLDPTSAPTECKAINRQDIMLDPTSAPTECKAISRQDSMLDPISPPPECKTISRQDSMVDKGQQLIVDKQVFKSTTQKLLPCQNREYASIAVPKTCDFEESESNSITKKDLKEESMMPPNRNLSDTSRNSQIYSESVRPMEVYSTVDQLEKGSETSLPNREGDEPNPQCLPSKNSHSVSMIIKEKGFQADIGLFDSEPIHSPPKHVNTLEVPLQTCTSEDKVKEENSAQTNNSLSINMNPASATELNSETKNATDIIVKDLQPQVKHQQSTNDYKLKGHAPGCADHNITSDDPSEYEEKQSSRQFVRTQVSPGQAPSENPTMSFKKCSSDGYISPPPQTPPPLAPSGVPPAEVQDLNEALLTESQPTKRPQLQALNSEPLNCVTIPPQVQQKSPLNPFSFQPGSLANSNFQPEQTFDDKPFKKETSPDKLCGIPPYRQVASPKMVQEARPQFMCSPVGFPSSYATERGNEGLSFAENIANTSMPCFQYHQSRRKVLYDPETGKYFYIEVPVQPQRKMLYDPETGQYVEVLIPQQCLAQSSVYQPPTSLYSSFVNPGIYGSPYVPYAGLPMPPHAASPLRHPDLHNQNLPQNHLQLSGTANQALQNTQPAEPSCLESMYYIPTGMAASSNPTQPSFYQKAPSGSPGNSASVPLPIQ